MANSTTTTTRKLKMPAIATAIAICAGALFAARAYAMPQPNMEAALHKLEEAKAALDRAEHNKGGFRVKAIEHVNQAIAAVREGIAVGNK
jgi:hypothetical protein